MEKHYRKYIALLFITLGVFCIFTTVYILFAIRVIVNHNSEILREMSLTAAEAQQRRTIDNVIIRIENKRTEVEEDVTDVIHILAESVNAVQVSADMGEEILSHLEQTQYANAIQILIEYPEGGGENILITKAGIKKLQEKDRLILDRIENNRVHYTGRLEEAVLHIFAPNEAVEEMIKEEIREEIHATEYGDERYIWVNEVLNFEGGDDYAIRVIHPNLVESEGSFLSTNTEDAAGNRPYWNELMGIKKDGEIFHSYYFKRMNSDEITEKVSYARLYEPYHWIVATGEPLEEVLAISMEVQADSDTIVTRLIGIFIFTDIILVLWIFHLQKGYRRSIDSYVREETELDPLTGALSRKAGQAELETHFSNFQTKGGSYMLAMMDIDKFKEVNDTHGHAAGDKVLRQVSQVLLANIRGNDRLIRWGGDEFVLLCVGVEEAKQAKVANKLLNCIRALQVGTVQQPIRLTLSMGYTSFAFSDKSYQQTMERVDEALYHAKETGRNRYAGYDRMAEEIKKKKKRAENCTKKSEE